MNRDRVLTGIRSNGEPHIGNYLGAMLPMVEIQKAHGQTHDMFFFVPDLHSFTTPIDHASLYRHTLRNLKYFAAAGMDFWAEGAYLYRQSYIPAHSELAWILNCFTQVGELGRMTQFKEKAKDKGRRLADQIDDILREQFNEDLQNQHDKIIIDHLQTLRNELYQTTILEQGGVGLLDYPVLMAADILLYNARYVPIGDDQKQHLELARDLGIRINNKFNDAFPDGVFTVVPEEWKKQLAFAKRDNGVRIRSLRNPDKKMSKSVEDPAGTINLTDDPAAAAKKIMGATTDSVGVIHFDFEKQPGVSNLLQILALLNERPVGQLAKEWDGQTSYGKLKKATAERVEQFLGEFQARAAAIDESRLFAKLGEDEAKVTAIADATLLRVQQAVGLRPRA